jgi:hypothetical protein
MFSRASSNPMCAEAVRELPDGGAWTYKAKLDDYRCLAAKRTGGVVLWSRRGNEFTARFPEISQPNLTGIGLCGVDFRADASGHGPVETERRETATVNFFRRKSFE